MRREGNIKQHSPGAEAREISSASALLCLARSEHIAFSQRARCMPSLRIVGRRNAAGTALGVLSPHIDQRPLSPRIARGEGARRAGEGRFSHSLRRMTAGSYRLNDLAGAVGYPPIGIPERDAQDAHRFSVKEGCLIEQFRPLFSRLFGSGLEIFFLVAFLTRASARKGSKPYPYTIETINPIPHAPTRLRTASKWRAGRASTLPKRIYGNPCAIRTASCMLPLMRWRAW